MSRSSLTRLWDSARLGPLSEQALRDRFQPPSHYRVSVATTSEPGALIMGIVRAGTIFVVAGRCELKVATWSDEIGPGEFVSFPSGESALRVLGDRACEFVKVWDILMLSSAES